MSFLKNLQICFKGYMLKEAEVFVNNDDAEEVVTNMMASLVTKFNSDDVSVCSIICIDYNISVIISANKFNEDQLLKLQKVYKSKKYNIVYDIING